MRRPPAAGSGTIVRRAPSGLLPSTREPTPMSGGHAFLLAAGSLGGGGSASGRARVTAAASGGSITLGGRPAGSLTIHSVSRRGSGAQQGAGPADLDDPDGLLDMFMFMSKGGGSGVGGHERGSKEEEVSPAPSQQQPTSFIRLEGHGPSGDMHSQARTWSRVCTHNNTWVWSVSYTHVYHIALKAVHWVRPAASTQDPACP